MKGLSVDVKQSLALQGKNILHPSGLGSCSGFLLSSTHFLSGLDGPCAQNQMKCQRKLIVHGTMTWKVHQFNKTPVEKEEQASSKANYVKGGD